MCVCVSCGVHVCGSACALASLSHMCGACAVSAGLGEEEELGDSRAQRRDSDRQAGSRRAACQGASTPTLGLLRLGGGGRGGVFGPGLYMLPQCPCVQPCAPPPTHASLVPSLTPTPTIPHLQGPLKPFFMWFPFNLHPPSVTSIRKTSSHLVNDSPILAPSPTTRSRHKKGTCLWGH